MAQIKGRPILFSAPMVRAILAGTKTQTRRAVKPVGKDEGFVIIERGDRSLWPFRSDDGESTFHTVKRSGGAEYLNETPHDCPYGKPGDRLWVRETWSDVNLEGVPGIAYRADDDVRDLMAEPSFHDDYGAFNYDDARVKPYDFAVWSSDLIGGAEGRWRPSIHMPRWASRITLEITGVRVERLQDISATDAKKEGIEGQFDDGPWRNYQRDGFWFPEGKDTAPILSYCSLWESINGPGSWDANPWVWAIEFRRVEQ